MAYDRVLADRVREVLAAVAGVDEKPMSGELAFLINGNMAMAVSGQGDLMVRVPPGETAAMLGRAHVSPMIMSGREARGWIRVEFAGGLPPK